MCYQDDECKPCPVNVYDFFAGPNPVTSFNPVSVVPKIDPSAFIGPFSVVIGDVTIAENVFVAPNASIRADEGTPFYVGKNTNLQDGVILHGLQEGRVRVNGRSYSIFIGENVSCAHGCIIHGPCRIGDDVFVGFHAIVYNAIVGAGSFVSTNALVTGGVILAPRRYVPAGAVIDTQAKADALGLVPQSQEEFAEEVQHVNQEFPAAYSILFGSHRCSCGLAYETGSLGFDAD
jgi:carbonic anhydrase/acetyltransferase-like protein (isoleucine patch superfamily)